MSKRPLISVVLPAYNAEQFLYESIQSILTQSLSDFELIVINDGSKDNTEKVVNGFNDPRIRYFSQDNKGMAATLNKAIELSVGEFVARMDADDIAFAQRFEKQISFLRANPEFAAVGTRAAIFSRSINEVTGYHNHSCDHGTLCVDLLFDNPFVHSSMMIRRKVFLEHQAYDLSKHSLIQDFELWSRFSQTMKLANIPEVLMYYREVNSGISQTTKNYREVVIEQAIVNVNSVLHDKDPAINSLLSLYHGNYQNVDSNISLNKYIEILKKIEGKLVVRFDKEHKLIKVRIHDYINLIKYRYNTFQHLKARQQGDRIKDYFFILKNMAAGLNGKLPTRM